MIPACTADQSYSSTQYLAIESISEAGGPSNHAGALVSTEVRNLLAFMRVSSIKAGSTLTVYGWAWHVAISLPKGFVPKVAVSRERNGKVHADEETGEWQKGSILNKITRLLYG